MNNPILAMVNVQAEDEGLWFKAETALEAYLQRALRSLHLVIENNLVADRYTPTGNKRRTATWNYYEVRCEECLGVFDVAAGSSPNCVNCEQ